MQGRGTLLGYAVISVLATATDSVDMIPIGIAIPNLPISHTRETTVFVYPPHADDNSSAPGYLSHFWATGQAINADMTIRYYIDHEPVRFATVH